MSGPVPRPRQEAIEAAAEIAFEAIMRIETERAIAALKQESGLDAGESDEADDQNPERN